MVFPGIIPLLLLQHFVLTSHHVFVLGFQSPHSLVTDKATLLAFKNTIATDPKSRLANWDDANEVCNFTGVVCSRDQNRVSKLILHKNGLKGRLSPLLSNLTALRTLDLFRNHFFGIIPPEFSSLRNLRFLLLDGNNLRGPLPELIPFQPHLKTLTLFKNGISGSIPASFFSNCTSLENLDLSSNFLTGPIPTQIGHCPNLWMLNLYSNQLTGSLPPSLANASILSNLDVENNFLTGELPSEIVVKLASINYLHLSYNNMVSHDRNTNLNPFFESLANCTGLVELQLTNMNLGGKLPTSIGNLGVNVTSIELQENRISGPIPPSLGNLTSLAMINLTLNLLTGKIPADISRLSRLEQLLLSHNLLTDTVPSALGQITRLGLLDLSHNKLSGEIPRTIGDLVRINFLFLNNNFLCGAIPPSLGQCADLNKLDLSYNRLKGRVPKELWGIRSIRIFLNLSHNFLEGPFPVELGAFENVQELDLSSNNLTGSMLAQISSCTALRAVNLSYNSLRGPIPESIGVLQNLESFDVSKNYLFGKIPLSLSKVPTLKFLNLSFNELDGEIPSEGIFSSSTSLSFLRNRNLCGSVSGMPRCPQRRPSSLRSSIFFLFFSIIASIFAFALMISCVFLRSRRTKGTTCAPKTEESPRKPTTERLHSFPRITHWELSEATGGFHKERLIGSGSYGHVYKGILLDGTVVAVKVLDLEIDSTKSFNRECQVLRSIRHRNLIRVITACSLPEFKALILPYMANGSLDQRLYRPEQRAKGGEGCSDLSLTERVNICSDVAEGMAYLHHCSPVKVIHCDLKPSNVLLNEDMTALVSDFGISRLVMSVGVGSNGEGMGDSTANLLSGSIGYIAPEYGCGSNPSTKGDVYSFGILVLELVTRKRPTDDMFSGGMNLQKWVRSQYHGELEKVIDPSLLSCFEDKSREAQRMWEVGIIELIELGIFCAHESPSMRPTMLQAADGLDRLKRYLRGDDSTTYASYSKGRSQEFE